MNKARIFVTICLAVSLLASFNSFAQAQLKTVSGKVTMLRVHDVGSKYGPPSDQIDVEVVFKLNTETDMTFGFQLRSGTNLAAHQGMLDLLRDAFNNGWTVHTDYNVGDVEFPKKNKVVFRIWLTK